MRQIQFRSPRTSLRDLRAFSRPPSRLVRGISRLQSLLSIDASYTPCLNKKCQFYFLNNSVKHWAIFFIIFGKRHHEKCSLTHLTLILLLHYLVKFMSRSLAVYNNEFILRNACVGSEMINWLAKNTIGNYCLLKNHTCHITSLLLLPVLKMSSSSTNASNGLWRYSPAARSITRDSERLTRC